MTAMTFPEPASPQTYAQVAGPWTFWPFRTSKVITSSPGGHPWSHSLADSPAYKWITNALAWEWRRLCAQFQGRWQPCKGMFWLLMYFQILFGTFGNLELHHSSTFSGVGSWVPTGILFAISIDSTSWIKASAFDSDTTQQLIVPLVGCLISHPFELHLMTKPNSINPRSGTMGSTAFSARIVPVRGCCFSSTDPCGPTQPTRFQRLPILVGFPHEVHLLHHRPRDQSAHQRAWPVSLSPLWCMVSTFSTRWKHQWESQTHFQGSHRFHFHPHVLTFHVQEAFLLSLRHLKFFRGFPGHQNPFPAFRGSPYPQLWWSWQPFLGYHIWGSWSHKSLTALWTWELISRQNFHWWSNGKPSTEKRRCEGPFVKRQNSQRGSEKQKVWRRFWTLRAWVFHSARGLVFMVEVVSQPRGFYSSNCTYLQLDLGGNIDCWDYERNIPQRSPPHMYICIYVHIWYNDMLDICIYIYNYIIYIYMLYELPAMNVPFYVHIVVTSKESEDDQGRHLAIDCGWAELTVSTPS